MNNKRRKNGWMVAVVIALIVLMIANVCVGGYVVVKSVDIIEGDELTLTENVKEDDDEDDFDFDFEYSYNDDDDDEEESEETLDDDWYEDDDEDDEDDSYSNGGFDPSDYSYIDEATGEEYYNGLKDAIRYDLDYSLSWKEYEYDTDYENVEISAYYPELEGDIPNLDYINDYIFDEVLFWEESFEEYVDEGYFYKDDEFQVDAFAYITYMDEEKMSVVFSEYGYADDYYMYYLYSINIDVENGVILQNSSIIDMDDEFAIEFRERNKEQNHASGAIDEMTDQEIVENLNDPAMGIVFYTPLGLEVGINVEDGWYTVTYKDYEKYLKKL